MSDIAIFGAGAFGGALAVAQSAAGKSVTLWGRNQSAMTNAAKARELARLPGIKLSPFVTVTSDLEATDKASIVLLAMPAQQLRGFLEENADRLMGRDLVVCSKGIDLETGLGSWSLLRQMQPASTTAILTGPSFAVDIANGLPTALTLASDAPTLDRLQEQLSTSALRLYRGDDPRGAELGGALKNVVAIAAGLAIGAGFGESARAALIARGFAEMSRLTVAMGGQAETLFGLSGLGDLALTCSSEKSRNFSFGLALGKCEACPAATTVEGASTARAVQRLAKENGLSAPLASCVVDVIDRKATAAEVAEALLARPLKSE